MLAASLLALALAAAGWIAWRLALPTVVGYMLVGLALSGAQVAVWLGIPASSWPALADLAVLPILFAIGLELDLKRIRQAIGGALLTLPLDILVPALAVASVARLGGWPITPSLVLGLCACLSSTLFGERLASTAGFTPHAKRRALGVLLGEDIVATLLLALVALLATGQGVGDWLGPASHIGFLLLWFLVLTSAALVVLPRLLDALARTHSHELLVVGSVGFVIVFAVAGALAGSRELGALVGGVAAAEAGSRFVVRNALQSIRELSLALFFFVSGIAIDPRVAVHSIPLALGTAAAFLVAKLAVHAPAALAAGLDSASALRVALSLGTMGEFNLILVAAAIAAGSTQPGLQPTIVGAMLALLLAVPLLLRGVPRFLLLVDRLPERPRAGAHALAESLRRVRPPRSDPVRRRSNVRLLMANLVVLAALGSLAAALSGPVLDGRPGWAPALYFGAVISVATPFVYSGYRAYRSLVRGLAGFGEEAEQSAVLRSRLVDAWVAATAIVLLVPISLLAPTSLPVLLSGLLVAVVLVAVAGRQLTRFHRVLAGSVTRVLGQEAAEGQLLDRVLQRYPWGIRFAAVAVPHDSPVAGQTIASSRITALTGATVAVLQRGRNETLDPPSDSRLAGGDTLVLLGEAHQLAQAESLVVAHGEAIRLTAQSRLVEVADVTLDAGSRLVGQITAARLRGDTGALLAGVWRAGAAHPEPPAGPAATIALAAGDRLILLGSRLQVTRVRELAAAPARPAA